MTKRDSLLRDRENQAARDMRNARWEHEENFGPFWLWFLIGFCFVLAIGLSL
jgi:hypothetical protein